MYNGPIVALSIWPPMTCWCSTSCLRGQYWAHYSLMQNSTDTEMWYKNGSWPLAKWPAAPGLRWWSSCLRSRTAGLHDSRASTRWAPPCSGRSCSGPSCWSSGPGCRVWGSWDYSSWMALHPLDTGCPRCSQCGWGDEAKFQVYFMMSRRWTWGEVCLCGLKLATVGQTFI